MKKTVYRKNTTKENYVILVSTHSLLPCSFIVSNNCQLSRYLTTTENRNKEDQEEKSQIFSAVKMFTLIFEGGRREAYSHNDFITLCLSFSFTLIFLLKYNPNLSSTQKTFHKKMENLKIKESVKAERQRESCLEYEYLTAPSYNISAQINRNR